MNNKFKKMLEDWRKSNPAVAKVWTTPTKKELLKNISDYEDATSGPLTPSLVLVGPGAAEAFKKAGYKIEDYEGGLKRVVFTKGGWDRE